MRLYDVTVYGSTGYTGRLVCEYLLETYGAEPKDFQWCVAGRSESKLLDLKQHLGTSSIPHIIADGNDQASLNEMAKQSRVIISTVGPYSKYGTPLVQACAEQGTHSVDLTGESPWVQKIIEQFHDKAKETGAKIVPSCGFDSIPADIGAFMVARHLRKEHKCGASKIIYYPGSFKGGGFSGGTAASAAEIVGQCWENKEVARKLANPLGLCPPEYKWEGPPIPKFGGGFGYDELLQRWTAPFLFGTHDQRLVYRSSALLGNKNDFPSHAYGQDMIYKEVVSFPGKYIGFIPALFATVATSLATAFLYLPPTRKLLYKFLPAPGQGPTKEQRDAGSFMVNLIGEGDSPERPRVFAQVGSVHGDCGYKETAKMLSECALTLALNEPREGPKKGEGGILTTASALGGALVDRLIQAKMTLTVKSL